MPPFIKPTNFWDDPFTRMLTQAKHIEHTLQGEERITRQVSGSHAPSSLASPSLGVAVARVSRAAQTRLESSARRRCSAGSILANSQRARYSHQRLILEALADTRAALSEVLRIDLGNRYVLQLEVSDWEGWPRIELRLIDSLADFIPGFRGVVKEHLSSGALERSGHGLVFLALNYREVLARLDVSSGSDLESLPQTILEGVQYFLGRVACTAQESFEAPPETEAKPTRPLQTFPAPEPAKEKPKLEEVSSRNISAQAVDQEVDGKLANLSFFSD